jgi:hypothetical protein
MYGADWPVEETVPTESMEKATAIFGFCSSGDVTWLLPNAIDEEC